MRDACICITSCSSPSRGGTETSSPAALQLSEGCGVPPAVTWRCHTATARVSGLRENARVFSLEVGKPVLRERTEEGFVQWGRWERQSREA